MNNILSKAFFFSNEGERFVKLLVNMLYINSNIIWYLVILVHFFSI
jgi:hypothetical protein